MLEIDEDQLFQEKVWLFQRVGWGLLLLFLAVAAFGLTGPSPFTRVVEEKAGHRLEYPRFARQGTQFEMILAPAIGQDIFFSREILRKNEISTVMPLPVRGESRAGGMNFQFLNAGRGEVHVDWKPREAGWTKGTITMGNPPVEFELKQFVYF